jgi:hypothetical protein
MSNVSKWLIVQATWTGGKCMRYQGRKERAPWGYYCSELGVPPVAVTIDKASDIFGFATRR